jgi:hypothetical protein
MLPVTTARILTDKALQETCGRQCVDWAIGLLERGQDSPHLRQLAGMLPPYNHFEIAALRDRTIEELKIAEVAPAEVIREYAAEVIRCALDGDLDVIIALKIVADLCVADKYPPDLMDFYCLYFAHIDLQDGGMQWYWNGATRDNIDEIFRELAQQFVAGETGESQVR